MVDVVFLLLVCVCPSFCSLFLAKLEIRAFDLKNMWAVWGSRKVLIATTFQVPVKLLVYFT